MSEEINNMNNEIKYAKQFHDLYEKYAPDFGYETRKDTKEFDPETPNGRLMTKVCNEVISQALQKRDEEIIKLIKTPMSTEFEDPEEESADYSIEDFRARLLSTLTTK